MEPVSIIGGAFLSALFEFPCRRGIEWSFERLSRGQLDPNHNIMRAAAFARWNASLHLLEKAEEATKDWQRAEGDYQLQATGRWAEGIKAKKALQSKMGKVHKMSVEEMAGDDALSIERIEAAINDLLAAEKNQKAAVEELAARGAVAELLNLGGWDELPPPLEQAFLSPTDGFQAAFAATIGNLLSTNDTRWSPFQKIRQVLHDAEVEEEVAQIKELLSGQLDDTRAALRNNEKLLDRFLVRIFDDETPPEQYGIALDQIVERYRRALKEAETGRNLSAELEEARAQARAALDEGDLERAELILRTIRQKRKAERDFEKSQATAKWREEEREDADILAEEAAIVAVEEPLRGADLYLEAAKGLPDGFESVSAQWREAAANLLQTQGEVFGNNDAFDGAIRLLKDLQSRAPDPLERARISNNLGNALSIKGERGDDQALEDAITAYRNALEEWTQEHVPLDWAMTQNNLGNALRVKGERGDDQALEDAITAYRDALQERTRERVPLDWAMTQSNLGGALRVKGERGDDQALDDAIAAFRLALQEWTRERVPLQWATTQNNLGTALKVKGKRGDDLDLEDAITAYRNALQEWTRERVPLDWAMTQNNLGNALLVKGERGDDEALEDALTAYRDALQERTRERVPLDWAMTQNNLGTALLVKGERGDDEALEDALTAYRNALQEWTRERVPLDWAMTQNNLGIALKVKGERGDDQALKDAIACYRRALEERTEERAPYYHERTKANLERALALRDLSVGEG